MKFSSREIRDLAFAGILISLAFAILLSGGFRAFSEVRPAFIMIFGVAFFTAGLGFLLHELMHKWVAQRYKLFAEFRAFYAGLWLALIFSFFGFIIAAPGAVYINGAVNRQRNGKIALAGPVTNIVLAFVFGILLLVPIGDVLRVFFSYGLQINALLGAFNMIPAMPFDGGKVILWNKAVYFTTLLVALALLFASFVM